MGILCLLITLWNGLSKALVQSSAPNKSRSVGPATFPLLRAGWLASARGRARAGFDYACARRWEHVRGATGREGKGRR